jgi:hypothetical protein
MDIVVCGGRWANIVRNTCEYYTIDSANSDGKGKWTAFAPLNAAVHGNAMLYSPQTAALYSFGGYSLDGTNVGNM